MEKLQTFIISPVFLFLPIFQAKQPTVCVTRAGRAAGRRPTGKMLRRRKRLGIAPESPASGARFVRRSIELEDSVWLLESALRPIIEPVSTCRGLQTIASHTQCLASPAWILWKDKH